LAWVDWEPVRDFAGATSRLAATAGHPRTPAAAGKLADQDKGCPRSHLSTLVRIRITNFGLSLPLRPVCLYTSPTRKLALEPFRGFTTVDPAGRVETA